MTYIENIFICMVSPLLVAALCMGRRQLRFFLFCIAGMGVCLLSAYINTFLAAVCQADALAATAEIAPVVEEMMKLLPLVFYLLVFEPEGEKIKPAAITIALAFATFENVCYLIQNGADRFSFIFFRGFGTGAMHVLCGGIVAKIRKMNLFAVLDVASLGYLIGQGVGRWGNFVNQEAFGCATDLPWGMYSDRTAAEVVGNVHPCFLYESILCLLGFVLLHLFTRHLRRYDGQTFLLYIIWYGVTRFFIEGLRTDSLLLPGIDLRVSQVLAAASALVAVVLLIVFRNCHKLTGCGSRKAMEAAGLTVEDKAEKVEIDDTAESTIFSGMSAEEAQEHMTVGTGVKKAAEAENEKTEGNADANTSEEPSDEAEEANETAEGESEEKNDGSEN